MSSSAEYVGCAHEKFAKFAGHFAVAIDTFFELLVPPGAANQVPIMGPTTVSTATVSECLLQEWACRV